MPVVCHRRESVENLQILRCCRFIKTRENWRCAQETRMHVRNPEAFKGIHRPDVPAVDLTSLTCTLPAPGAVINAAYLRSFVSALRFTSWQIETVMHTRTAMKGHAVPPASIRLPRLYVIRECWEESLSGETRDRDSCSGICPALDRKPWGSQNSSLTDQGSEQGDGSGTGPWEPPVLWTTESNLAAHGPACRWSWWFGVLLN